MKIFLIVLLVLFLLSRLPIGVRLRYDAAGTLAWLKVWFVPIRLYPKKPKKAPEGEENADKKDKKEKKKKPKRGKKKETEAPPEAEEHPKGGSLDLLRAALPLAKDALVGVKRRLTIKDLELHVTWAAADPADAAVGYGYAQAALGTLWGIVRQNFKVKRSRLGCSVDFDAASPTVYADAALSVRIGQIFTLVLPLLVRFLKNNARVKREKAEKNRKEA